MEGPWKAKARTDSALCFSQRNGILSQRTDYTERLQTVLAFSLRMQENEFGDSELSADLTLLGGGGVYN